MPLGTFIAGPYTSAYAGASLGLTQDGFEVRLRPEFELIGQTDVYGDSVIDMVYRGGNALLSLLGVEFAAMSARSAVWPFGPLNTTSMPAMGFMGLVGQLAVGSSLYRAMVLTAIAGTTAAATPATMTCNQAIMADQSETQYMMTSRNRTTPLVLRLLPYQVTNPSGMAAGTYTIWFLNA